MQPGGQLCKQCKWCQLMTKFWTNASCAVCWLNLWSHLVVKFLSVRIPKYFWLFRVLLRSVIKLVKPGRYYTVPYHLIIKYHTIAHHNHHQHKHHGWVECAPLQGSRQADMTFGRSAATHLFTRAIEHTAWGFGVWVGMDGRVGGWGGGG